MSDHCNYATVVAVRTHGSHSAKTPRLVEPDEFRKRVGEFATGVTVVTTGGPENPAGMTLNSFISVSLEPLLILISLAHQTRTLDAIRQSESFAVSILHRWQHETALRFARSGGPFPDYLVEDQGGFSFVAGSLARIGCQVDRIIPAGDHDLVLGAVVALESDEGEPLIFHRGRLGGLAIDSRVPADSLGGWDAV